MSMSRTIEEEITNTKKSAWADDAENIIDAWRKRHLLFLGRIVRLGRHNHSLLTRADTNESKRTQDRQQKTIRHSLVDGLKIIILDVCF